MGEFFDLTQDPLSGVAELVFNQPQRLNTMTPAFFPALRDACGSSMVPAPRGCW